MTARTMATPIRTFTRSADRTPMPPAHYSITLPPGGPDYRAVRALSARLAARAGVPPRSRPHITIQMIYDSTDETELHRLVAEVAAHVPPFLVAATGAGVLASPTDPDVRYVHLTLARTPEIVELYERVTSALGALGLTIYAYSAATWVPHLTLVGGELPTQLCRELVDEVRRRLRPCSLSVQTLCLNRRHPDGSWSTEARFRLGRKRSSKTGG